MRALARARSLWCVKTETQFRAYFGVPPSCCDYIERKYHYPLNRLLEVLFFLKGLSLVMFSSFTRTSLPKGSIRSDDHAVCNFAAHLIRSCSCNPFIVSLPRLIEPASKHLSSHSHSSFMKSTWMTGFFKFLRVLRFSALAWLLLTVRSSASGGQRAGRGFFIQGNIISME